MSDHVAAASTPHGHVPGMDKTSALETALQVVGGARQAVYGPPVKDFGRTGRMWAAILGLPEVTPEQVALCMAALKISRLCQTPGHEDSLVDLAGYTRAYELVREARQDAEPARLSARLFERWPAPLPRE